MNRDDIIYMAREARLCDEDGRDSDSIVITDYLERFAKLVAAAEREACAKVCDDLPVPPYVSDNDAHIWDLTCVDCAAAIRERGTP
jgi:hypothetical protein